MPLKHRAETALLLLLGLAICVTGFLLSLLPFSQNVLGFLAILTTLTVLYPLSLGGTFYRNRADYEFRMLHWFPFWMTILFAVLTYLTPKLVIAEILSLGFFFLWSLPLVALGIAFLIIFALHVLRRSTLRTTLLTILLLIFAGGAIAVEAVGTNPEIAKAVFSEPQKLIARAKNLFAINSGSSGVVVSSSSSSRSEIAVVASSRAASRVASKASSERDPFTPPSSASLSVDSLQVNSSLPPIIDDRKPNGLTGSGSEMFVLLLFPLLALYSATLHRRAQSRV